MWKLFRESKELTVRFCERYARLCDAVCRRAALRERATRQRLWLWVRL
jgi:hypothetical protein